MDSLSKDDIRHQSTLLRRELAAAGVADVNLAAEFEFLLPKKAQGNYADRVRETILDDLAGQIRTAATPAQQGALRRRADDVRAFNDREIFMYDLLADERIRPLAEPLFGTQRDGTGYYDGEDVLEFKMTPADESGFERRLDVLRHVFAEKAGLYGFNPAEIDNAVVHLNYSFHDEGGNLLAAQTHAPDKLRDLVKGVSYALTDVSSSIDGYSPSRGVYSPDRFLVHPGREEKIRIAPNRMELRLNKTLGEMNVGLINMFVLTGAAYGLRPDDQAFFRHDVPSLKLVQVPVLSNNVPELKVLQHAIEGSPVGDNGYLKPPAQYVWESFVVREGDIARGLGLESLAGNDMKNWPSPDVMARIRGFMSSDAAEDLLARTKIVQDADSGAYRLEWPAERMIIEVRGDGPRDPNGEKYGPRVPFDSLRVRAALAVRGMRTALIMDPANPRRDASYNAIAENRAFQSYLQPHIHRKMMRDSAPAAMPQAASPQASGADRPGFGQRLFQAFRRMYG